MERGPTAPPGVAVAFPAVRSARDVSRLAPEVFALPARLADVRGRRVVVALDEFQAVGGFNGGSVEEALRAAVQHQRRSATCSPARSPSLMERDDRTEAAVLQGGAGHAARKDPGGALRRLHRAAVRPKPGMRVEPGFGAAVLDLAGHLPYDVQRLAHETWDDVRARAGASASAWTICTRRCAGCWPSRACSSRRRGSA